MSDVIQNYSNHVFYGRRIIYTDAEYIDESNILNVLSRAMVLHNENRAEIQYLYNYYRGVQPILDRVKEVRPEICNRIIENRAYEIVTFKTGYLVGEPIQYVSRGDKFDEEINILNEYVFAEEKESKDKDLADWFHICGTAYRMAVPDNANEQDESPFEIHTLDPRNTFVIYSTGLGNKPMLGVSYTIDENGVAIFNCYTDTMFYTVKSATMLDVEGSIEKHHHTMGAIPIIEYPLNMARLGAFEVVLTILDAINNADSNRLDAIEQTVQALLVFHNVEIDEEKFERLRQSGAVAYKDIDPQLKGTIEYINQAIDQGQTQTLTNHLYNTVLTICGMPNRNGGTSTSDTGTAVIYRDGWSTAESLAKNTEKMFAKSERQFLKVLLAICNAKGRLSLKVSQIDIRFTRRNYENIMQKAQVLDLLLKNTKVHPKLAFEHAGLFADPDLAYTISKEYSEEQEAKIMEKETAADESGIDTGNDRGNLPDTQQGQTGGDTDGTGQGDGDRDIPEVKGKGQKK